MRLSFGREEIERFRDIVSDRLGLSFDASKLEQLGNVLGERTQATGCQEVSSYLDRLVAPLTAAPEVRALAEQLTVAETYFFRYPDHFRALVDVVIPERIRAQTPSRRLRILSAGCSSGEEPYTLAILLRENFPDLSSWEVNIVGINVNASLIAKAKQAKYSEWSLRETPEPIRQRYFSQQGKEFLLDEGIRRAVHFEERNLVDENAGFWRPGAFDIVFCRNVTMYFTPEAMRDVVTRIARAIAPGGFLFLGPAETLRGLSQDFHLRHTHATFYYQIRPPEELRAIPGVMTAAAPVLPAPQLPPVLGVETSWLDAIGKASERIAALAASTMEPTKKIRAAENAAASERFVVTPTSESRPTWDLTHAIELFRQERFQDAIATLRSFPPEAELDPDVQLFLAVVLTQKGHVAEAEQICQRILARDELNTGAHYLAALCREHAGDRQAAWDHDETTTYLDPTFAMPHLHMGLLAKARGQLHLARREFSQALVLLAREDASRILLFGGGFNREALLRLCRAELQAAGGSL